MVRDVLLSSGNGSPLEIVTNLFQSLPQAALFQSNLHYSREISSLETGGTLSVCDAPTGKE